ncbi:MAG: glycosyltransferase family 4 protein [Burkholderiales bacterium]
MPFRSICFVAPAAYPILARDREIALVGGAEVQQCTLAREFARRGWRVSMTCMDFGQPDGIEIDGVTVHRMHAPQAGLPVLRFVHPRLTSLWSAMSRADADVYYQRAVGPATGFVAAFAAAHGRLSIYSGASDPDFEPALPSLRYARDRVICRWGLRHVGAIVTQTPRQQRACLEAYGRESTVIPSCYAHQGAAADKNGPVLWVGALAERKRPDLLVELARLVPERRFKLIGGGDPRSEHRLRALGAGLRNLEIVGFVPHADIERHFDGASVLVNTSPAEGFPNTFLQAWSRGMPTLSFFDAEASHEGQAVGLRAADLPSMAAGLRKLLQSPGSEWDEQGARCRRYLAANHRVEVVVSAYEALFARRRDKAPVRAAQSVRP